MARIITAIEGELMYIQRGLIDSNGMLNYRYYAPLKTISTKSKTYNNSMF